eukprot:SAG11_NODE_102_length_16709_cov_31.066093_9_plen_109_part_00
MAAVSTQPTGLRPRCVSDPRLRRDHSASPPIRTSSIVHDRWVSYMAAHDLTPELLGAASWETVLPTGRADAGAGQGRPTSASPLTLRRLFYWSVRETRCQFGSVSILL